MTNIKIAGWKTYAVAALCIAIGVIALSSGYVADGMKGILGGCALIALRDGMTKILRSIESNRRAFDNLRAIVETEVQKGS